MGLFESVAVDVLVVAGYVDVRLSQVHTHLSNWALALNSLNTSFGRNIIYLKLLVKRR